MFVVFSIHCISKSSVSKYRRIFQNGRMAFSKYFLPARRYASAGLCDSDVSVRLSVCHTPVLCIAERKQDREMYTI